MGLRKELKNVLRDKLIARDMTIEEFKIEHYDRNKKQSSTITYQEVITGSFGKMSDKESALHKFDKPWDNGNKQNSKWVSDDGTLEYVFRYIGTRKTGGFELVMLPLNIGTFNFEPSESSGGSDELHTIFDVVPWLLWGNSKLDGEKWSTAERIYDSIGEIANGNVNLWVANFEETVYDFTIGKLLGMSNGDNMRFAGKITENFDGNGGEDTVNYKNATRAVTASLENGDGYDGWAKGDSYQSIENLTGSNWGDILIGDKGANVLKGLGGRDHLYGLGGKDTIKGGMQDDFIYGGKGKDTIDGGKGNDTIYGGGGDDTITIKHEAADIVDAGDGDDIIIITKGYDHIIDGGDGWDIVDLRGLDLTKMNPLNFTNIEEVWTDDVLITPVAFDLGKVKLFGTHKVEISMSPDDPLQYLFGGSEVEFDQGASLEVVYSLSSQYRSQLNLLPNIESYTPGHTVLWSGHLNGNWSAFESRDALIGTFDAPIIGKYLAVYERFVSANGPNSLEVRYYEEFVADTEARNYSGYYRAGVELRIGTYFNSEGPTSPYQPHLPNLIGVNGNEVSTEFYNGLSYSMEMDLPQVSSDLAALEFSFIFL